MSGKSLRQQKPSAHWHFSLCLFLSLHLPPSLGRSLARSLALSLSLSPSLNYLSFLSFSSEAGPVCQRSVPAAAADGACPTEMLAPAVIGDGCTLTRQVDNRQGSSEDACSVTPTGARLFMFVCSAGSAPTINLFGAELVDQSSVHVVTEVWRLTLRPSTRQRAGSRHQRTQPQAHRSHQRVLLK